MAVSEQPIELFEKFIQSEDAALAAGRQGEWYPSNWHRLTPNIKKAPALLPDEQLRRFYFHLLRHAVLPGKAELKHAYPVLEQAYRDHLGHVNQPGSFCLMDRFLGLLLFGFDDRGTIAANNGVDEYLRGRAAHMQFSKYSHIPGILGRPTSLISYAGDAALVGRLCALMKHAQFIHDDHFDPASPLGDKYYGYTRLTFWAAMFTLRLSPLPCARDTIAAFQCAPLPRRADQMEIFERLQAAALKYEQSLPGPA